jgi:hypothetical protein
VKFDSCRKANDDCEGGWDAFVCKNEREARE